MELLEIPRSMHEKQIFWKNHYDAYINSQLSLQDFCAQTGIIPQSFGKWVKQFSPEQVPSNIHESESSNFVQFNPMPLESKAPSIHCRLPNGIEFDWDASIPNQQIAEIIRLVGL